MKSTKKYLNTWYTLHEGEGLLKGFHTEIKKYQNTKSTKLPTMLKMKSTKKYLNTWYTKIPKVLNYQQF